MIDSQDRFTWVGPKHHRDRYRSAHPIPFAYQSSFIKKFMLPEAPSNSPFKHFYNFPCYESHCYHMNWYALQVYSYSQSWVMSCKANARLYFQVLLSLWAIGGNIVHSLSVTLKSLDSIETFSVLHKSVEAGPLCWWKQQFWDFHWSNMPLQDWSW